MQISNDEICLGANINKFDQMWYLLHICIDFAVVVNPFFRAVLAGSIRLILMASRLATGAHLVKPQKTRPFIPCA